MNAKQRHRLESLKRVMEFLTAPIPEPTLSNMSDWFHNQVNALKAAIERLGSSSMNQISGEEAKAVAHRKSLRRALKMQHLTPIRAVATVIGKKNSGDGMERLIEIPTRFASEEALLTAAKSALENVRPYADTFIQRGLTQDFLARFENAISELETIRAHGISAGKERKSGTVGLKHTFTEATDLLSCINASVQQACDRDPVNGEHTRELWNARRKQHKVPVKEETTKEGTNAA